MSKPVLSPSVLVLSLSLAAAPALLAQSVPLAVAPEADALAARIEGPQPLRLAESQGLSPLATLRPARRAALDQLDAVRAWNASPHCSTKNGFAWPLPLAREVRLDASLLDEGAGSRSDGAFARTAAGVAWGASVRVEEAWRLRLHLADVRCRRGRGIAEGGGGAIPSRHATVYLARSVRLERPSSVEGEAGEWPDPLVPRVDRYAGERRSAFPFDLEPARNQPLWIELYVPPETLPGVYRGEVRVSVGGEPRLAVPLRLEVWPFTLPSTASFPTSFGLSGISAIREHRGGYTGDEELFELTRRYAEAALGHRLSLHGGSMTPPPVAFREGRAEIDWGRYDREVGPLLDGTVFGPGDPLPGARVTTIDVITPPDLVDEERVLYWRACGGPGPTTSASAAGSTACSSTSTTSPRAPGTTPRSSASAASPAGPTPSSRCS